MAGAVLFLAGGFEGTLDFLFVAWLLVASISLLLRRRAMVGGADTGD